MDGGWKSNVLVLLGIFGFRGVSSSAAVSTCPDGDFVSIFEDVGQEVQDDTSSHQIITSSKVVKPGQTIDVYLLSRNDLASFSEFFVTALDENQQPFGEFVESGDFKARLLHCHGNRLVVMLRKEAS